MGESAGCAELNGLNEGSCPRFLANDQPVFSPGTNQPSPRAPVTRSQRDLPLTGVNSAEGACHLPCSTLAQVCRRPACSAVSRTTNAKPASSDQKPNERFLSSLLESSR